MVSANNFEQVRDVGVGWAFICHKGRLSGSWGDAAIVAAAVDCFGVVVACRGRRGRFVVVLGKNIFGEVIYGQAGRQSLQLVEKTFAFRSKLVHGKIRRHGQDVLDILGATT